MALNSSSNEIGVRVKKAGKIGGKKAGVEKRSKRAVKLSAASEVDPVTASLMDLSVPLHPLGFYATDRTQLMEQVFKSLAKDNQWQTLLPDILRDVAVSEVKRLCVQQLEIMSKKRIRKILAGEEMESSSGTEDSDEGEDIVKKAENSEEAVTPRQAADSTSNVEDGNNQQPVNEGENVTQTTEESGEDMLELHAENSDDDMLSEKSTQKCVAEDQVEDDVEEADNMDVVESEEAAELKLPGFNMESMQLSQPSVTIAKTCMEILELELRARAIKALLKSQTTLDENQPQANVEPNE